MENRITKPVLSDKYLDYILRHADNKFIKKIVLEFYGLDKSDKIVITGRKISVTILLANSTIDDFTKTIDELAREYADWIDLDANEDDIKRISARWYGVDVSDVKLERFDTRCVIVTNDNHNFLLIE